jgi:hypothetical protein
MPSACLYLCQRQCPIIFFSTVFGRLSCDESCGAVREVQPPISADVCVLVLMTEGREEVWA